MDIVAHERYLTALEKAGQTGAAALTQELPPFALHKPVSLVREAWYEWRETKRFWDSDLPPDLWDVELRQDVRTFGRQMEYLIAEARTR